MHLTKASGHPFPFPWSRLQTRIPKNSGAFQISVKAKINELNAHHYAHSSLEFKSPKKEHASEGQSSK